MNITLLEIDANLKSYADSYLGINTYYSHIVLIPNDVEYPMMLVEYGNSSFPEGAVEHSVTCNFLDILNDAQDNDISILSRMEQMIVDFKTNYLQLKDVTRGFYIPDTKPVATKIQISNPDNAIGYSISFIIVAPNDSYLTDIPL